LGLVLKLPPLIAAEASYFCLGKSNQNRSQRKGFFAAQGLSRTNQEKPCAAIFLPGYPIASIPCMQKVAMRCPAHIACRFFLVSPEAAPLGRNSAPNYWMSNAFNQLTGNKKMAMAVMEIFPKLRN